MTCSQCGTTKNVVPDADCLDFYCLPCAQHLAGNWEAGIKELDPCPKCGHKAEADPVEKGILCACHWEKDVRGWREWCEQDS